MPNHRGSLVNRRTLVNRSPLANIVTRRAFNARQRELKTRRMPLCKISTRSLARIISNGLSNLRIANKTKHKRLLN